MGVRRRAAPTEHRDGGAAHDGDVLTTDGPYAEGKEHLGGFTIIAAPDLDAALDWGRKLPAPPRSPSRFGRSNRTEPLTCRPSPLRRSGVCSARSTAARLRSWSASSATSTSPRRRSRTRSPPPCSGGRPTGSRRARRDGSSPPPATAPSTVSAARHPVTTGTRRRRCCTPGANPSRRAPCPTTGSA